MLSDRGLLLRPSVALSRGIIVSAQSRLNTRDRLRSWGMQMPRGRGYGVSVLELLWLRLSMVYGGRETAEYFRVKNYGWIHETVKVDCEDKDAMGRTIKLRPMAAGLVATTDSADHESSSPRPTKFLRNITPTWFRPIRDIIGIARVEKASSFRESKLIALNTQLASLFSIYGCWQCCHEVGGDGVDLVTLDAKRGTYVAPALEENAKLQNMSKNMNSHEETRVRKTAGTWGYALQIIYQVCAGAVTLTDCVFWFVLYPFLTSADYRLSFMDVSMHSINAVFLLGDVFLNGLRFPFFRITYFILLTGIFVIFQWIIHACVSMWWPYPFLDLSLPYAPIWYLGVGLLHLPCYSIFALIVRMKHLCLSRLFPDAF
ncbi:hypothetical protein RHGRI_034359 [Rhododendron griersonianum]|uniref:Uncharacterized protein n=1 Tax=Rhododendron griersonianum TaxID=479676 RepID=A0AAV6I0D4_9ERIC|nr:hypothetical protein RHGRI_034359 [Rhododendron griersonianum]